MKPINIIPLLLLLLFISCSRTCAQANPQRLYDPYFVKSTDTVSNYAPNHITRDLLQDKKGHFWFATWLGIVEYDGKVFINHTLKDDLVHFHVFCCYEDKKGNLWFGTARGGAYCYNGTSFKLFTTKDGLADNNIACISEDAAGNIWFGTEHGASRYNGSAFTNFTAHNGFTNDFVNSILQDKAGKLWFGTNEGLYVFDGKVFNGFTNTAGQPFKRVLSLSEDEKGNIWIGRMDGLTRCDDKSCTDLLSNLLTYYIIRDRAGNIWFTHSEHNTYHLDIPNQVLYRYDGKNFTRVMEKDKPNDFQIFGKIMDKDGNIWFGTMHGPCRYDGRTFTYFTK